MFFWRNEMRNDLRHGSHSRRSWAYAKGLEERDSGDLEPLNLGNAREIACCGVARDMTPS